MKEKRIKVPDPDHPISIYGNPARIVVSVAGRVIADTRNALTLREADYPPVQYIPREDVDLSQLKRTDHATYCPYKSDYRKVDGVIVPVTRRVVAFDDNKQKIPNPVLVAIDIHEIAFS